MSNDSLKAAISKRINVVPSGCWIAFGRADKDGYREIRHKYKKYRIHRAAYEAWNGPIPEGFLVCHKCDRPACCNPAHLFLGTQADNIADAAIKDRRPRGEKHHNAKFSSEVIELVRKSSIPAKDIAKLHGMSVCYAYQIRSGLWRSRDQTKWRPKQSDTGTGGQDRSVSGTQVRAEAEARTEVVARQGSASVRFSENC